MLSEGKVGLVPTFEVAGRHVIMYELSDGSGVDNITSRSIS